MPRVVMTIDHNKILSNISNPPPLLLHLSPDSGANQANLSAVFAELNYSRRKKLSVTTASGQQCYVEIAWWDDTRKQAALWVKVPSMSSSADTVLYLDYSASMADNSAYVGDTRSTPGEAVWADFAAVYHLTEQGNGTPGEYKDSTSGHHDGQGGGGTPSMVPTRVMDELGLPVQSFGGYQNPQYIKFPDCDAYSVPIPGYFVQTHRVSIANVNMATGADQDYTIYLAKTGQPNIEWHWLYFNNTNPVLPECWAWYVGSPTGLLQSPCDINNPKTIEMVVNRWYNNAVICHATSPTVGDMFAYQDGLNSGPSDDFASHGTDYHNGPRPLIAGTSWEGTANTRYFWGRMSEIRFSNKALSATMPSQAWFTADAWSVKDNLISFTAEPSVGDIFPANAPKTATVPITVTVANLPCFAEIFLGPDQAHKAATSGQVPFTSKTTPVNVAMPITMPAVNGTYHVYVDVFYQGAVFERFQSLTDVTVLGGSIGPIVWS